MTKRKEIEVIVHYPENREECEQKIREAVAEWYAGVVESELEQSGLGREEKREAIDRLISHLKEQEKDGMISMENTDFASMEQ